MRSVAQGPQLTQVPFHSGIKIAFAQHEAPAQIMCKTEATYSLFGQKPPESREFPRSQPHRQKGSGSDLPSLLKQVPEGLVVYPVMELDLRAFDDGSQQLGAAIGGGFFEIAITTLHIGAEDLRDPVGRSEVGYGLVDVV